MILRWLAPRSPSRVLDLGCSDGYLAERLRSFGHHVTGMDLIAHDGVQERVDQFFEGDLELGLPLGLEGPFDFILAADVLEHVRSPERILDQAQVVLAPGGSLIVSVPNFAHWYPRLRVMLGRFDYDRRGILDRDHVRFFTKRSFERLASARGYRVVRRTGTGLPIEIVQRGSARPRKRQRGAARALAMVDRFCVAARPQLFAYQLVYELMPISEP